MVKQLQKQMLLGIPVANASLSEIVEAISSLVSQYKKDKRPKYVTTINHHFFSHVWGWGVTHPRNAELLHILRTADLITVEGKGISHLSKCLSEPLQEMIPAQELFPKIAESLQMDEGSVYLLGGANKIAWKAADLLKKRYPFLRIVGILAPVIHTTGDQLVNTAEKDALIVESINEAAPDILFIQLGNPKQEIWFDRIRRQLKVPVTIGIGDSFEKYAGTIPSAPQWMQNLKLSWLFRTIYEPKRIWKKYFSDFFKSIYYYIPLISYHHINKFTYHLRKNVASETTVKPNLLFVASHLTLSVIRIPVNLNQGNCQELLGRVEESLGHNLIIFDFGQLKMVDLVGLYTLFNIWKSLLKNNKEFYGLFLNKDIRLLFKLHRVWDIFSGHLCEDPQDVLNRSVVQETRVLFESIHQSDHQVAVYFFGRLDNQHNYEPILERLIPIFKNKDGILNFRYCTEVDNAGFAFILALKAQLEKTGYKLTLKEVSLTLQKQFKLAQADFLLS